MRLWGGGSSLEPLVKLPRDILGTHCHAQIYSFSGAMLVKNEAQLTPINFLFRDVECFITSPFRLSHASWRPIPQLNHQNVELAFGSKLEGVPLQIGVVQALATSKGATLRPFASRGDDFQIGLPPDSLILVAPGEDLASVLEDLAKDFIPRLVSWLRVLTKQWWIGQPTEHQTGNLHFEFEIEPNGSLGPTFAPRAEQATAPLDMKAIDQEIWSFSVSKSASYEEPKWTDVVRCDVYSAYHNRDYRMAILLTCCWIELLRDEVLTKTGKRINNLKTSSTDLLKQLSVGFRNVYGRDISVEQPASFAFLSACWIARGDLAHGRPMSWKLDGSNGFHDLSSEQFHGHIDAIGEWLADVVQNIQESNP